MNIDLETILLVVAIIVLAAVALIFGFTAGYTVGITNMKLLIDKKYAKMINLVFPPLISTSALLAFNGFIQSHKNSALVIFMAFLLGYLIPIFKIIPPLALELRIVKGKFYKSRSFDIPDKDDFDR